MSNDSPSFLATICFLLSIVISVGMIGYLLMWLAAYSWIFDIWVYGCIFVFILIIVYAFGSIRLMLFQERVRA